MGKSPCEGTIAAAFACVYGTPWFLSLFYNGACERYRLSFAAITFPIGQLMLARSMLRKRQTDVAKKSDDRRTSSSLTLVTIPFDERHGSGRPVAARSLANGPYPDRPIIILCATVPLIVA